VAGNREPGPAVAGDLAGDAGVGLDDDRDAPQRASLCVPALQFLVLTGRQRQRIGVHHVLDRAIDAVVLVDACEVPLHDLGDRVLACVVERVQFGDRHLEEIVLDAGLAIR